MKYITNTNRNLKKKFLIFININKLRLGTRQNISNMSKSLRNSISILYKFLITLKRILDQFESNFK